MGLIWNLNRSLLPTNIVKVQVHIDFDSESVLLPGTVCHFPSPLTVYRIEKKKDNQVVELRKMNLIHPININQPTSIASILFIPIQPTHHPQQTNHAPVQPQPQTNQRLDLRLPLPPPHGAPPPPQRQPPTTIPTQTS